MDNLDRLPPQNLEAESSVLGAILLDNEAAWVVAQFLKPEHFYKAANRLLFEVALELVNARKPVDELTLLEELTRRGALEQVGGRDYLKALVESVPSAANAEYYGRMVRDRALLRTLITSATAIVKDAYDAKAPAETVIDAAEKSFFEATSRRVADTAVDLASLLDDEFKRIEAGGTLKGIMTDLIDLDEVTNGFKPSELIILAARPSMGKCLARDAEIVLESGEVATIEEVYRRPDARLLTLGDDLRLSLTSPSDRLDDGRKPVFRVTTRLGRRVDATLPHPFLTPDGWRPLADLAPGARIAVPRRIPVFGRDEMRECLVKLHAYAFAGKLEGEALAVDRTDAFEQHTSTAWRRAELARRLGVTRSTAPREWLRGEVLPRAEALASVGCADLAEKPALPPEAPGEIPAPIFRLPSAQLALFLNRLFAGRGRVAGSTIALERLPERVLRQAQHLLLRFGVVASVDGKRLEIAEARSIRRFAKVIGILGQQIAVERVRVSVGAAGARKKVAAPVLAGGVGIEYEHESEHEYEKGDILWDSIVSIEDRGLEQVYDLTVEGTHNFVANDVCVHNTSLALSFVRNIAVGREVPVIFYSLEMSRSQVTQNMLCAEARVNSYRMRKGELTQGELGQLTKAADELSRAKIFIDDASSSTIMELRAKARMMKLRHNVGMIVIDYLQLMEGERSRSGDENRAQEISTISRGLKQLARELEVPVIALAQLNRGPEQRESHKPRLSDLRESGSIEQDADIALLLYREAYYKPDSTDPKVTNRADVIVAKNRNGPTGEIPLYFHKEYTRFDNWGSGAG